MSQPDPIGAIGQILYGTRRNPADSLRWHTYEIESPRCTEAGQWCNENILGTWTFKADFRRVTFYIKDKRDAIMFKLAWWGL